MYNTRDIRFRPAWRIGTPPTRGDPSDITPKIGEIDRTYRTVDMYSGTVTITEPDIIPEFNHASNLSAFFKKLKAGALPFGGPSKKNDSSAFQYHIQGEW